MRTVEKDPLAARYERHCNESELRMWDTVFSVSGGLSAVMLIIDAFAAYLWWHGMSLPGVGLSILWYVANVTVFVTFVFATIRIWYLTRELGRT